MAFPTIPTTGAGRLLTTNQLDTSATKTFPSLSGLTKNSGDLLIAICVLYQSTTTSNIFSGWGGSFTEFHDSGGTNEMVVGMAYKWSTGSETGTFTVTVAGTLTGDCSMILMSIPGAHLSTPPEAGSRAVGTSSAADPASFDPAGWAAEDTLWINVLGSGMTSGTGSWTACGTAGPTNYTNYVDTAASDTSTIGDCEAAVSFRQVNASAENAGAAAVDTSNARNVAVMIAVRPQPTAVVEVCSWRFRNDDGSETTATWMQAEKVNISHADDTAVFRLRFELEETAGGTDTNNFGHHIRYQLNGGSHTDVLLSGSTRAVLGYEVSPNVTDLTATTDQLTAGSGTFVAGVVKEDDGTTFNTGIGPGGPPANSHMELEFVVRLVPGDVVPGDVIEVELWDSNTGSAMPLQSGVSWPQITVSGAQDFDITHAAETDSAGALRAPNLVHAAETDTARPLRAPNLTAAAETDTARPLSLTKTITRAAETDTALALVVTKPIQKTVTQAAETDTAQALSTASGAQTITITYANELDNAGIIYELEVIVPAAETDSAQPVSYSQADTHNLTPAQETDTALPVSFSQVSDYDLTHVTETDSARPLRAPNLTPAGETDSAVALDKDKARTLTPAAETDTARPLRAPNLTPATETDTAQLLTYSGPTRVAITQVTETDLARPVTATKTIYKTIGVASETDTARPVTFVRTRTLTLAGETDTARPVTLHTLVLVGLASETDSARPLTYGGFFAVDNATETDTALALRYAAMPPSGTVGSIRRGRIVQAKQGRVTRPKEGAVT